MILTNNQNLYLTGISKEVVPCLGNFLTTMFRYYIEFYIVPDDFPIVEDGIIGASFLDQHQAKVNWEKDWVQLNQTNLPFINKEIYN